MTSFLNRNKITNNIIILVLKSSKPHIRTIRLFDKSERITSTRDYFNNKKTVTINPDKFK